MVDTLNLEFYADGINAAAARSNAELNEPRRKLPETPIIFVIVFPNRCSYDGDLLTLRLNFKYVGQISRRSIAVYRRRQSTTGSLPQLRIPLHYDSRRRDNK